MEITYLLSDQQSLAEDRRSIESVCNILCSDGSDDHCRHPDDLERLEPEKR